MNNLFKSVFNQEEKNNAVYSTFSPYSPSKLNDVSLENGVMTISGGSIYSPCEGEIESVSLNGENYSITIKHSETFKTVIEGVDFCYQNVVDKISSNIPLGYSEDSLTIKMFNGDSLLTNYSLENGLIIWQV